ncbi:DUF2771 domain-containing protein [Streptomyces albireticuli]|uniref:DUF2771 domain-containing protein n=1 Tax=Streptomyces albireticuli TaxID=1940 RepID=UPI00117F0EE9|nr:DUF2771 domain-containing protein [Streptomyces albireticuli]MCD9142959.1 DUF2771 domain-containing protein [Streptomyces albireticuli]MCD9162722.1 DUF2771 domain-containing protein [Streptomyces albireticuli]MCD9192282.1 DUF2771 domain-containing protein [Streptomyces albireticuli]
MTAAFFRGKRRRAAAAAGAVTFGLLALSACDKPTPLATVTVGSTTVTTEAACYEEGKELGEKALEECTKDKTPKTIKVKHGDKVRVGVEPDIADKGWVALTSGPMGPVQRSNQLKQTYTTLNGDELFVNQQLRRVEDSTILTVLTKDGVWNFKLELDKG